ncbi:glutamate synthase conserved region-containing protein [Sulfobacillus thermosulfidooxidans DSM 9293]|uniref:Glutamate synthase conserved region-containing protein n=1 Tax=Sulfobacillus thermosulfidooxidans (strain DSM 9293 / VKM B-1269 / AT-1) TaxID=929705 RepID=A0A1W1WG80_SULTA|nr:FMN-binding glutamate synthase family protein [Sulfobacillus thermosulfidooxidans]SMC05311.1 glutamate synthase conserved region-containing protein [Sulfobacillus thermosulfidooxidans DSM 9293]
MFWQIFGATLLALALFSIAVAFLMPTLEKALFNYLSDQALQKVMKSRYMTSLTSAWSLLRRANPQIFLENSLRATQDQAIGRPMGTPLVFSHWENLVFNPAQLAHIPTRRREEVELKTVIGPKTARPLVTDIPILIAAMSYGGALSMKAKIALALGANMAGTATNTGESYLPEERDAAKRLIVQYHRGTWPLSAQNHPEYLESADAIEIQIGQGAQAASAMITKHVDPEMQKYFGLKDGDKAVIAARLQGVETPQDFVRLVHQLKGRYSVPVGVKIAPSGWLEDDLAVILDAHVDFIVLDGGEGGTHSGPPILQDDFGIPTMAAISWADQFLREKNCRQRITLIAAGGLRSPGDYLKAMALGADAVYIGYAALMALSAYQAQKVLPYAPPEDLLYHKGKHHHELDVDQAARHLAHFLRSSCDELRYGVQAVGKTNIHDVNRDDLVALDPWTAQIAGVKSLVQPWISQGGPGVFPEAPHFQFRSPNEGGNHPVH